MLPPGLLWRDPRPIPRFNRQEPVTQIVRDPGFREPSDEDDCSTFGCFCQAHDCHYWHESCGEGPHIIALRCQEHGPESMRPQPLMLMFPAGFDPRLSDAQPAWVRADECARHSHFAGLLGVLEPSDGTMAAWPISRSSTPFSVCAPPSSSPPSDCGMPGMRSSRPISTAVRPRPLSTRGSGFVEGIGWSAVIERARHALDAMPDETVLVGVSMGTGVVSDLWAERPGTAGVVLLHATADIPDSVRPGLRVQLHAAEPDRFAPSERVAAMTRTAREAGVDLEIFRYPGAGHFYTDRDLPDYDPQAAELTWRRVLDFAGQGRTEHVGDR
ncbi:UNVERIFIED_CONTAM: putative esterase [Streptomyces graminofaciens]